MSQENDQSKDVPLERMSELLALWRRFKADRESSARNEIIDRYLPFARIMAAKAFANRTFVELEFNDFMQYASIGLIEAIERFDPERGVKFETFAASRITGAILNGIESFTEKQEQVSARRRIVSGRLDSLKKDSLESKGPDALFEYLAEVAIGLAVGFILEDSGMYQAEEVSYPDNSYSRVELKQLRQQIRELLASLPANEKRVLSYHYLHQIQFEEIARISGLTKGRISQIHKEEKSRTRPEMRNATPTT